MPMTPGTMLRESDPRTYSTPRRPDAGAPRACAGQAPERGPRATAMAISRERGYSGMCIAPRALLPAAAVEESWTRFVWTSGLPCVRS